MRNPIRSEADALHLAINGAGLTGAALTVGVSFDAAAGGALFAAGLAGAVVWRLPIVAPIVVSRAYYFASDVDSELTHVIVGCDRAQMATR